MTMSAAGEGLDLDAERYHPCTRVHLEGIDAFPQGPMSLGLVSNPSRIAAISSLCVMHFPRFRTTR
jgi:hypothetical protein